jgi:hypothetical protein
VNEQQHDRAQEERKSIDGKDERRAIAHTDERRKHTNVPRKESRKRDNQCRKGR